MWSRFALSFRCPRTVRCVCRVCVMHAFYAFCTFHALIESVSYGFIEGCAPEKRPCTPKDTILTPGFGFSITPVPKFPDRPGRENRVHFSYAFPFFFRIA